MHAWYVYEPCRHLVSSVLEWYLVSASNGYGPVLGIGRYWNVRLEYLQCQTNKLTICFRCLRQQHSGSVCIKKYQPNTTPMDLFHSLVANFCLAIDYLWIYIFDHVSLHFLRLPVHCTRAHQMEHLCPLVFLHGTKHNMAVCVGYREYNMDFHAKFINSVNALRYVSNSFT